MDSPDSFSKCSMRPSLFSSPSMYFALGGRQTVSPREEGEGTHAP